MFTNKGVIKMSEKNLAAVICSLIVTFAVSVTSAQEDYDYQMFLDVPVKKIISCWDGSTWDHSVYSTRENGGDTLIIVCHGVDTGNNDYMIQINAEQRSDYAEAVEWILRYWESQGYLSGVYPKKILLHTCFSGKARYPKYTLTNFHKLNMQFATLYTGINAHSETYDQNGNVTRLQLYNALPIQPGTIRNLAPTDSKVKIIIDG